MKLTGTGIYGPLIRTLPERKQKKPMLTCNHGSKIIKELVKEPTLNRRMFVGTLIKLHDFFEHFSKP